MSSNHTMGRSRDSFICSVKSACHHRHRPTNLHRGIPEAAFAAVEAAHGKGKPSPKEGRSGDGGRHITVSSSPSDDAGNRYFPPTLYWCSTAVYWGLVNGWGPNSARFINAIYVKERGKCGGNYIARGMDSSGLIRKIKITDHNDKMSVQKYVIKKFGYSHMKIDRFEGKTYV